MSKHIQHALLFVTDFVTINLAFLSWARIREALGHFAEPDLVQLLINSIIIFLFWFLGFIFWGLYRSWHAHSRVDEVVSIFKVISIGVFLIFLITFDLSTDVDNPIATSRAIIVTYWLLMAVYVSIGRMLLRTFQRSLLEAGIGERKALIVGWGEKARSLFDEIRKCPAMGYRLIGFIDTHNPPAKENYRGCPVAGSVRDMKNIIEQEEVDEILLAVDNVAQHNILEILALCSTVQVQIKSVPSFYDITAGQVRTHQIYGIPLINLMAEPMARWEYSVKRMIDILSSLMILGFATPLWIYMALTKNQTFKSIFLQKGRRVGRGFKDFEMYSLHLTKNKFRKANADVGSKVEADASLMAYLLERFHINKLPQFLNVLKGEMSLIGPRPERLEFAEKLKDEVQLFQRRMTVRPGIIGWAQLKGDRGESIEAIKRTLQYDFYYIENMSLRMDAKIFLVAIYTTLFGKKFD